MGSRYHIREVGMHPVKYFVGYLVQISGYSPHARRSARIIPERSIRAVRSQHSWRTGDLIYLPAFKLNTMTKRLAKNKAKLCRI